MISQARPNFISNGSIVNCAVRSSSGPSVIHPTCREAKSRAVVFHKLGYTDRSICFLFSAWRERLSKENKSLLEALVEDWMPWNSFIMRQYLRLNPISITDSQYLFETIDRSCRSGDPFTRTLGAEMYECVKAIFDGPSSSLVFPLSADKIRPMVIKNRAAFLGSPSEELLDHVIALMKSQDPNDQYVGHTTAYEMIAHTKSKIPKEWRERLLEFMVDVFESPYFESFVAFPDYPHPSWLGNLCANGIMPLVSRKERLCVWRRLDQLCRAENPLVRSKAAHTFFFLFRSDPDESNQDDG